MARLHLIEFEDQTWFPGLIRNYATDILQFNQTRIDQSSVLVPKLLGLLADTGARRFVDLCSGGSGPWLRLVENLRRADCDVEVLLTDRYPSREALEKIRSESDRQIDFSPDPVDVVSCLRIYSPGELESLRRELPPNDYVWDIGGLKNPLAPFPITYLIAKPG